jgi:beta-phosphoglucomutase-like phosphatase (HAD superfamily)
VRDLQLVVFDCDGVLVDSEVISNEVLARSLTEQGLPTRMSLRLTKLDGLFPDEVVFSAYSVARGKPHPDLFLHSAATMAVEPSRCAVVEDTPSGVTAAVSAGMRALGYAADSDEAALRQAGARTFMALNELPAMLGLS